MRRTCGEILRVFVLGGSLLALVQAFLLLGVVPAFRVSSESMEPTLLRGTRLFVDRTAFWWQGPERWQVVVLACPDRPGELCVKRVVGLPGERVQIRSPAVWIDGERVSAPRNLAYGPAPGQDWGDSDEYVLGPQEFFVLGDNSPVSEDSRVWRTAVRLSNLVGRPLALRESAGGRQPSE